MGKEGSGSFWINADFRVQRGDLPPLAEGRRAVRSPHLKFLNFAKFYKILLFFSKVLSLKILQNCTKFYIFLKSSELGSVDVGSVELNSNPWIRKDLFAR